MDKKLLKRSAPMSQRWAKLVFSRAEIEPDKAIRKQLNQLWLKGYGHKDAAFEMQKLNDVSQRGY